MLHEKLHQLIKLCISVISTWGGNHSSVDILVKPEAIQNVTRVFKRDNIDFDIVIDDLQRRINEENPPLDANELELQDRRGSYDFWVSASCLQLFFNNIPGVIMVLLQLELTIFGVTGLLTAE